MWFMCAAFMLVFLTDPLLYRRFRAIPKQSWAAVGASAFGFVACSLLDGSPYGLSHRETMWHWWKGSRSQINFEDMVHPSIVSFTVLWFAEAFVIVLPTMFMAVIGHISGISAGYLGGTVLGTYLFHLKASEHNSATQEELRQWQVAVLGTLHTGHATLGTLILIVWGHSIVLLFMTLVGWPFMQAVTFAQRCLSGLRQSLEMLFLPGVRASCL